VVWTDTRDGGTSEIYYKSSTDGGTTWGGDAELSLRDNKQSVHPSIAVAGSGLHVAWYDNRDGNNEIYYKRNPTGNVGTSETMNDEGGRIKSDPTIVRWVLCMPISLFSLHSSLFDMAGRQVMSLRPGPNDVSGLTPGVYFECSGQSVRNKIILTR
jgi:hypothetical protein